MGRITRFITARERVTKKLEKEKETLSEHHHKQAES